MIRGLAGFMAAAAKRRLKDFLLSVAAATAAALFAAVSLGFGTFAAYIYLRALEGRVVAALIVCAAYGLLAITIGVIGAARQQSGRLRPAAAVSAPASRGNVDSLLQHLAAAGSAQDQQALDAAMRLGRKFSPMQLLALALIGGFNSPSESIPEIARPLQTRFAPVTPDKTATSPLSRRHATSLAAASRGHLPDHHHQEKPNASTRSTLEKMAKSGKRSHSIAENLGDG